MRALRQLETWIVMIPIGLIRRLETRIAMIPINFQDQIALVTGVGDNESFAWFISKALRAAGAKVVLACHPRMVGIVESFLTRPQDAESRILPYGAGELKVEKIYPCDVSYDTMADVP